MAEQGTNSERAFEEQRGHEAVSVDVRGVGMWVGTLILLLVVVGAGMHRLLTALTAGPKGRPAPVVPHAKETPPSEPPLRADLSQQLKDLRAAERDRLTSYGWVDRDAEIVHIPIDRAMNLLLKRGLPVRDQKEEAAR